jgi:hypothetical protein
VRHFVLTRSAYGPDWTPEANARRLRITEAVTARLMAGQSHRDWTWIVLLDERDPMLEERRAVFAAAAPRLVVLLWRPGTVAQAPWDKARETTTVQKIAATAYRAPWAEAIGDRSELTLQTRLDDDDGLTPDALARTVRAARAVMRRTILMQPVGYRVWQGRAVRVVHDENAMHTLATMPGDALGVYDYGHRDVKRTAPIVTVDTQPAWLWSRHADTISGHRQADGELTERIRRLFPGVDWRVLE